MREAVCHACRVGCLLIHRVIAVTESDPTRQAARSAQRADPFATEEEASSQPAGSGTGEASPLRQQAMPRDDAAAAARPNFRAVGAGSDADERAQQDSKGAERVSVFGRKRAVGVAPPLGPFPGQTRALSRGDAASQASREPATGAAAPSPATPNPTSPAPRRASATGFQFETHGSRKEEKLAQLLEDSSDYENLQEREAGNSDDGDAARPFESDIVRDARGDAEDAGVARGHPLLSRGNPPATKRLVGSPPAATAVPAATAAGGVKRPVMMGRPPGGFKAPVGADRVRSGPRLERALRFPG